VVASVSASANLFRVNFRALVLIINFRQAGLRDVSFTRTRKSLPGLGE
jgi:hypothetical protein